MTDDQVCLLFIVAIVVVPLAILFASARFMRWLNSLLEDNDR